MAAALHFDVSVHNFGIQEYMRHTPETDMAFPHAYYFKDGWMHPGEKPGLGGEIDETLAVQFPYQRACLPQNRQLDRTMQAWSNGLYSSLDCQYHRHEDPIVGPR